MEYKQKNTLELEKLESLKSPQLVNLNDIDFSMQKYGQVIISPRNQRLFQRMDDCGKWGKNEFYCRSCEEEHGRKNLLKTTYSEFVCGVKYCFKTKCKVESFAQVFNDLKAIDGYSGWKKLQHYSIGFPKISLYEFKTNWSYHKKRFEVVLNRYWAKQKKEDCLLTGVRAWDFTLDEDGMIFAHVHIGALPFRMGKGGQSLKRLKAIERNMNKSNRSGITFHLERHGFAKPKDGVLAYIAKRAVGLYKKDEGKNKDFNSGKGRLAKDIDSGFYYGFKDWLTLGEYVKEFYGRKYFVGVGGVRLVPHGSNPTDDIVSNLPKHCPKCDIYFDLEDMKHFHSQVRIERTLGVNPPPEYFQKQRF